MPVKFLKNLFSAWLMQRQARRLNKILRDILRHGDVRQIRRTGRHLHRLGERMDIEEYKTLGQHLHEQAEQIVLVRVFKKP